MRFGAASSLALVAAAVSAQIQEAYLSLPDTLSAGHEPADWEAVGDVEWQNGRVQLTSIDKPTQKSAIWTKNKLTTAEWTIELGVEVAGGAQPGGALALWITSDRAQSGPVHGSKDNWDGFALILDSTPEGAGTLRGHLNDGSLQFAAEPRPADKAFSLCNIDYRNTGAQFTVRVGYGLGSLIVDVNGQKCFETDQVRLPQGQYIGVSADSLQQPDSFTVHKLKTYKSLAPNLAVHRQAAVREEAAKVADAAAQPHAADQNSNAQQQQQQQQQAEAVGVTDTQLQEIINKIGLTHDRLDSLDQVHSAVKELLQLKQQFTSLETRIGRMEELISVFAKTHGSSKTEQQEHLKSEFERLQSQLDQQISKHVQDHSASILGSLPETVNQAIQKGGPSIWVLFTIVIFVQGVLIVGYNVWRTRRSYHQKIL